jgi:hypothetical protein
MGLPTLDKTWLHNVNNILRTTGTALGDNRQLLLAIKNAMIGFGSSPWTVRGSSSSVAAGLDNVDRWAAVANLVWANAGSAHSWIVLKNTALGTNVELCIDLASTNSYSMAVVMSFGAAFTGGSTTARPTSTDEVAIGSGISYNWHGLGTATYDCVWHALHSTDGEATRIFVTAYNNVCAMWASFDKVKSPPTGWAVPVVACWLDTGTNRNTGNPQFAALNDYPLLYGRMSTGSMTLYGTAEGVYGSMVGEARYAYNDISSEWMLSPFGVASETPNARGRHGTLYDLFWGAIYRQPGDTWPDDNTRQFVQVGHVVVPWNGTVPQFGL